MVVRTLAQVVSPWQAETSLSQKAPKKAGLLLQVCCNKVLTKRQARSLQTFSCRSFLPQLQPLPGHQIQSLLDFLKCF